MIYLEFCDYNTFYIKRQLSCMVYVKYILKYFTYLPFIPLQMRVEETAGTS